MPKGYPQDKTSSGMKKIVIVITEADYARLVKVAEDNYRTPQLQAGFLIKQVLSKIEDIDGTADKILARARSRNGDS